MTKNERRMQQIERRLRAVSLTPDPWSATPQGGVRRGGMTVFEHRTDSVLDRAPDAEFAAEARQDVPWLAARVRQLEDALRELPRNPSRSAMVALALDALERDPIDEE